MSESPNTKSKLGQLKKLKLITDIWPSEPTNFTKWLCEENNMSLLCETLGIPQDFDKIHDEAPLDGSRFRADIVCKRTSTNETVMVIENQFGISDHAHLGKLMTYASALKAKTVVLIAEQMRSEHASMLNWLNEISDDNHNFFAVEIELWRIGESDPAPKFNVVVQPNEWTRSILKSGGSSTSETENFYLQYWEEFVKIVNNEDEIPSQIARPTARNYSTFSLGKTGFLLAAVASLQSNNIRAELYLTGPNASKYYDMLEREKVAIEKDLGSLDWQPLPNKNDCRISVTNSDIILKSREAWRSQHEWLAEKLSKFYNTFYERVHSLELEDADEN